MLRKSAQQILNRTGLRVTSPRLAILNLLLREHGPFSAEDLFRKLKKTGIDSVTIYRCLAVFSEKGITHRIDLRDGIARYEFFNEDTHHHHITCVRCRVTEDIEECVVDKLEKVAKQRGFSKLSHTLEIFGVCRACSANEKGSR